MAFNLFEVVRYEGNPDVFAWKYDNPNVKLGTTVVVGPNQLAFWVSNGVLQSTIGPGKHRINGNYVQGLSWAASKFTAGQVASSGEIWFVSTGLRNLRWGTPSRIDVNINYFGAFATTAHIAANGNVQVKFADSGSEADPEAIWQCIKELNELYGSGDSRDVSVEGFERFVKDTLLEAIQAELGRLFACIEYGSHMTQLPQLSRVLKLGAIQDRFESYGLVCRSFQVQNLKADDRSVAQVKSWWSSLTRAEIQKYTQMRAAEAKRYGLEQTGYGMAEARRAQGYTYQEERSFDTLEAAAGNSGIGGDFTSAGMGLAVGSQMGGMVGGMFEQAMSGAEASREQSPPQPPAPATSAASLGDRSITGPSADDGRDAGRETPGDEPAHRFCMACGHKLPTSAKFCSSCGSAQ